MKHLVIAATLFACDQRPAIDSCRDNLRGVWRAPEGARWMILDHGNTLEAFALFDDTALAAAPRVIDLGRGDVLAGAVTRRFMRGGDACEAREPIRITRCRARELELVLTDPQPPLTFAPCTWPRSAPSRVERWTREQ